MKTRNVILAVAVILAGCSGRATTVETSQGSGGSGGTLDASSGTGGTFGCVPGAQVACACLGGATGVQVCLSDHTFGACTCPDAGAGGSPDAGASDGDGQAGPDGPAGDARSDGAGPDGAVLQDEGGPWGPPSCAGLELPCGPNYDESCCATVAMPGGTFPMGRGTEDCGTVGCMTAPGGEGCPADMNGCTGLELPEHSMTLDAFALDKYEVTVGRFRRFVAAYAKGWRPAVGSGANPNVTGGDTSWRAGWDDSAAAGINLPATGATATETRNTFSNRLKRDPALPMWTDAVGANENKPINSVAWYEAFAFCIWDGGRLPTEAEWEYAAAGGEQNKLYPWGSEKPDCTRVNFYTGSTYCGPGGAKGVSDVGSYPAGAGRWGHVDLAGNLFEWVLDWSAEYSTAQSSNYANTSPGTQRVMRGGTFDGPEFRLRAVDRTYSAVPTLGRSDIGLRCARNP